MSLFNRQTLKNFFKKGQFPSEVHFGYMIDSMVNKIDDGFAKTENEGLQLSPIGDSEKILSIFEQLSDAQSLWQFVLDKNKEQRALNIQNKAGQSQLYLKDNGYVGIHNTNPQHHLDVGGTLAYQTRIGTYKQGTIPGDGKWHSILDSDQLSEMDAFEVTARIIRRHEKEKRSPAAAYLHAIALHAFYKGKIKKTRTHYGFPAFFYRLNLRWHGKKDNFQLQISTQQNYGLNEEGQAYPIEYHICKLWV